MICIFVDAAAIQRATESGVPADKPIRVAYPDGRVERANRVAILGRSEVVYRPEVVSASMARCFIETDGPIILY